MENKLLQLALQIVHAQASHAKMSGEEIEAVLMKVYNALYKIEQAEAEGRPLLLEELAVAPTPGGEIAFRSEPRSSIHDDKVYCLECGAEFRQLTANHLRMHQLTPREYKRKWGFPLKQPLAARILTNLRSRSAKKRGLPVKLKEYLEDRKKRKGYGPDRGSVSHSASG